jgi:glycosyltransferase involved in cell wall biosynthesis
LANYLCSFYDLFDVFLLVPEGELIKNLATNIKFIPLAPSFLSKWNLNKVIEVLSSYPTAVLSSFDPYSRFLADLAIQHISQFQNTKIKHISGVYHPRAYFSDDDSRVYHLLNPILSRFLGNDNLYFMNSECADSHVQCLALESSKSFILPIPLGNPIVRWSKLKSDLLRIVSVGRLVNFKLYVFGLIELAIELRRIGQPFELHIYGDGPLIERIVDLIEQYHFSDSIKLLGLLPYSLFQVTVASYDLFIGMGTAAMEAGSIGMPVILAMDSCKDKCYGYLFNLKPGFAGEQSDYYDTFDTAMVVLQFISLSQSQRFQVGRQCSSSLQALTLMSYVEEMERFVDGAQCTKRSRLLCFLLEFYFWLFHSRTWFFTPC